MTHNWKHVATLELQKFSSEMLKFPWELEKFYAAWLAQTYYYVSHSTRLLALGAARFSLKDDALHQRFIAHASEEKKHERLAELDLKNLGYKLDNINEFAATQAFYQSQYYQIEHLNPRCFLGYIIMLEGLAVTVGPVIYHRVSTAFGEKSCQFLKIHAEEDQDHIEKAFKLVEDLNKHELDSVIKSFDLSLYLYGGMLESANRFAHRHFDSTQKPHAA